VLVCLVLLFGLSSKFKGGYKLKKIISLFVVFFAFSVLSLSCFAITGVQSFADRPSPHSPDFNYSITDTNPNVFLSFKSAGVWYFAYYSLSVAYRPLGVQLIKGNDVTHFYINSTTHYVMSSSKIYIVFKNVNDLNHYYPCGFFQLFYYSGSAWIPVSTIGVDTSNFPSDFSDFYTVIPTGSSAVISDIPKSFMDGTTKTYFETKYTPVEDNTFTFTPVTNSVIQLSRNDATGTPLYVLSFMVEGWVADYDGVLDMTYDIVKRQFPNHNPNNPYNMGISVKGVTPFNDIPFNVRQDTGNAGSMAEHIDGQYHFRSYWNLYITQDSIVTFSIFKNGSNPLVLKETLYSSPNISYNTIAPPPIGTPQGDGNVFAPPVGGGGDGGGVGTTRTNWGTATDWTGTTVDGNFFSKGFDFIKAVFSIFPPEINALIVLSITAMIILGTWRIVTG
jgi:hypothetical protein